MVKNRTSKRTSSQSNLTNINLRVKPALQKDIKEDINSTTDFLSHSQCPRPLESSQTVIYRCPVCTSLYNITDRKPLCLPCGHTLCKACVYSCQTNVARGLCPFDRKDYLSISEFIPVNLALLEAQKTDKCEDHGLEIVGFCLQHFKLLCGRCVFEHRKDECLQLGSEKVQDLLHSKLYKLRLLRRSVSSLADLWKVLQRQLRKVESKVSGLLEEVTGPEELCKSLDELKELLPNDLKEEVGKTEKTLGRYESELSSFIHSYRKMSQAERLKYDFELPGVRIQELKASKNLDYIISHLPDKINYEDFLASSEN